MSDGLYPNDVESLKILLQGRDEVNTFLSDQLSRAQDEIRRLGAEVAKLERVTSRDDDDDEEPMSLPERVAALEHAMFGKEKR